MKTITNKEEAKQIMFSILYDPKRYKCTGRSSHSTTYLDEDQGIEYTICDYNFGFEIRTRNVD